MDWVLRNHQGGPAVMSMSAGASAISLAMNRAVRRVLNQGIPFVVAAGNSNMDACLSSPPSAGRELISVGAIDSNLSPAWFTNYGHCVTLFAPGVQIMSLGLDGRGAVKSGTSMACPFVSGAAALLLEENAALTPAQLKAALLSRAAKGVIQNMDPSSPNMLVRSKS
mmetsp:Transcript_30924/g.50024  ORF Transcript_30924/g.50024 Transcript_30924/m.50024 type:complete len:167 (-) Transcript_30924:371-871(-)